MITKVNQTKVGEKDQEGRKIVRNPHPTKSWFHGSWKEKGNTKKQKHKTQKTHNRQTEKQSRPLLNVECITEQQCGTPFQGKKK